ncbi:MAG: RimK family alpha-L-glutamate ligase [Methylophilaceae bacterium]
MRVPIITDEVAQAGGWHGNVLQQAFSQRGIEAVFVELQDCVIDLSGSKALIDIPQFDSLPKMAFIRGIAAGRLQQVITRLNVLHILSMQGTKVYNDAKAIERTVDKGMTSFLLKQHGVATPATWVCESRQIAHHLIAKHSHEKLVIKPLFGSQGQGVQLLDANSQPPLPGDSFVDGVFYLQAFIDTGADDCDYRVFVVNGKAIAAMRRSGTGWLNNVAQGAQCESITDDAVNTLAIQAAKAVDIDYCGVDIMRDKDGMLWVLEVNSIPAWKGLQNVTDINIAQILVDDLMSKVHG